MDKQMEIDYEALMQWDKNDLAECILDYIEDTKKYKSRIRLLESKVSKLRAKL
tara:strand:- start:2903 stop:3061 length:159 start_codon:yes stop_codon:yes gene_type:complete